MAEIKGFFKVNKLSTWSSNVLYAACFLKDRVLFIKLGGQFAEGGGAMTGAILGGALGGLIGSALDKKKPAVKETMAQKLLTLTPEELLKLDKHNFENRNEEIIGIHFKPSTFSLKSSAPRSGVVKIEITGKKPEEYDLSGSEDYTKCLQMAQECLPGKVTAEIKK